MECQHLLARRRAHANPRNASEARGGRASVIPPKNKDQGRQDVQRIVLVLFMFSYLIVTKSRYT